MSATIKPVTGARFSRIHGVGGYRPTRVIPNSEVLNWIDSSDEWIRTRSGIAERRWAGPEESVAEMSVQAAGKAIAMAGISPEQIGGVIVATVSHLKQTPAIATEIAQRLGCGTAPAFDISAACAGFGYGLSLADGMVRGGSAGYVLVIGVERLSDLTDVTDRSTAFIFGDGAGAAVVGPSETPGIGKVVWGSDGSQAEVISQTQAWDTAFAKPDAVNGTGEEVRWPALRMEGQTVFRWAVYDMAKVAEQALEAAGITADQLGAFIPHQANMRIIDAMVKKLDLPPSVPVARDIAETGNTSAASIPLAMERMLERGEAKSGDLALIIGFGAGLVYAAAVVTLP
ncbi:3-oxoacyl-[acyl-carrier-protein] synthase 3 protein 1 [Kitasatospora phosalacinea]|uniref:Beta-ketoacyl-[acyl-carrier-protein] synthase III n=1 Tax=Kitasatospora phosalacinea TaxID=2065 RepID=A0A9W6QD32_9ACTN|nr:beta-ketoacyl-ACP synthase III [Kitasatospora phosalacinea]GLW72327.1 3-oxoacyl-[acyl-carrier-protein] synthase 3 protein 1 [Kitasatospora phosalacinea]